jgi:hypothetical protein
MKTPVAFFCALLVAVSVSAQGAYNMAKQMAKNAASSESSGGQPAVASSATPPPPASSQPNPALEATLQNIANLHYDFEKFDSNPTNTQPLIKDLAAAAQSAQAKPDSISQLAGHLGRQSPKIKNYPRRSKNWRRMFTPFLTARTFQTRSSR